MHSPLQCSPTTTERHLVGRIDLRIVPFVCVLYLLAFLDRVNIANARAFGLERELGLTGVEFNTALTVFFVPYVLFEIPSNMLLKRFSPRLWLSVCCFGFGLVTLLQGFVQNYSGLLAARFFLGLFECGMVPGCYYLLGMWYKRSEAQKRFSLFFSSTALAGAFGGLLASAIGKMDGMRGYLGWRWIFILVYSPAVISYREEFPVDMVVGRTSYLCHGNLVCGCLPSLPRGSSMYHMSHFMILSR